MPTSSLVRDALFETGRIWPVRPGPVTRDQRLGHDPCAGSRAPAPAVITGWRRHAGHVRGNQRACRYGWSCP